MTQTHMKREIGEIASVTARLLTEGKSAFEAAGADLRASNPKFMTTIARGSSDHAATYFKYVCELVAGVPVASVGPSIASIFGKDLGFAGGGALAISQSGKSPDIVALLESAARSGAVTLALTNDVTSPLAKTARSVIDIHAGPELSVAATKTFLTSAVAGLAVVAYWQQDEALLAALADLPAKLEEALSTDWSELITALDGHSSMFVLGRGPSLAIACEAALKFKETSGVHAEAYSSAEVLHGPSALVKDGFPVLAFCANDAARDSLLQTADKLVEQGGTVFVTDANPGKAKALPVVRTSHPLTDPVVLAVSFYGFIEALARHRGFNPDTPMHLRKVTSTL